ncbi:MAG: biosynthetic arginine decarboxylase [Myxococcota bacterium]
MTSRLDRINPEGLRAWTTQESAELYNIESWGSGFFSVNTKGNVQVHPEGQGATGVDLQDLVEELQERGIGLPILIRFSDILKQRVIQLNESFQAAIRETGYKGSYRGVFPIKVNQQRHVVEEIVQFGAPYNFGLEAGSKPELFAVLALLDDNDALVVCNGYKDEEFLEMVMLATKMGKTVIPVIEKFSELETIIKLSTELGIRQPFGVRARLAAKGSGRWEESGGDRSKFGLTVAEILKVQRRLKEANMLDMLQLVHFHLGSQITNIRSIRTAMAEAGRIFVGLSNLGCGLRYIDVGGGLAVDYDGSKSNFSSSTNYGLLEYATGVVAAIKEACDEADVQHPIIISESGRALTAHQSVLIFNVLGVTEYRGDGIPESLPEVEDPSSLQNLLKVHNSITRKNVQESYHDALHYRDEVLSLFNLGYVSLEGRAAAENIFWAICQKLLKTVRDMDYVPEELEGLEKALADTYICNFSAFQSVPDFWAVQQLFPIVPIHRLQECPTRRGILADLTCDSDGKIDHFIDLRDVKDVLELHPLDNRPYHLGVFLVGAYQETLGDLHNLFGDTNAVHVSVDPVVGYRIEHVVNGDMVKEVLKYVQYNTEQLISNMRRMVENSVRQGRLSLQESRLFIRRYEEGLAGYTYME